MSKRQEKNVGLPSLGEHPSDRFGENRGDRVG